MTTPQIGDLVVCTREDMRVDRGSLRYVQFISPAGECFTYRITTSRQHTWDKWLEPRYLVVVGHIDLAGLGHLPESSNERVLSSTELMEVKPMLLEAARKAKEILPSFAPNPEEGWCTEQEAEQLTKRMS